VSLARCDTPRKGQNRETPPKKRRKVSRAQPATAWFQA
jgi:hypothetical protein